MTRGKGGESKEDGGGQSKEDEVVRVNKGDNE